MRRPPSRDCESSPPPRLPPQPWRWRSASPRSRSCPRRRVRHAASRPRSAMSRPTSGSGTGRRSATSATTVLGPAGYGGVQVAPPADSLSRDYTTSGRTDPAPVVGGLPAGRLQPDRAASATSSSSGTWSRPAAPRASRCIVDAVINHMTGQGHKSYGGVEYTHFDYPGLRRTTTSTTRASDDGPNDCPIERAAGSTTSTTSRRSPSASCSGSPTCAPTTRRRAPRSSPTSTSSIDYGVSGFRVDAAKHIGEDDLIAIKPACTHVGRHASVLGARGLPRRPGRALAVRLHPRRHRPRLRHAYQIKNAFKSYTTDRASATSPDCGCSARTPGLMPSDKTLVFVENHDTERGTDTLSATRTARRTRSPTSSCSPTATARRRCTRPSPGPTPTTRRPADANGYVTDTDCDNGWVCVDRYQGVRRHGRLGTTTSDGRRSATGTTTATT